MEHDLVRTYEVIGNIAQRAFRVGKFVVDRFHHDAWADLPHPEPGPSHPPQRAHLEHYQTGDTHEPNPN